MMRTLLITSTALLISCSTQQNTATQTAINNGLASTPGQLFCAIQLSGGGTIVAGIVQAAISSAAPTTAPIAVIATDTSKTFVDAACMQAAKAVGAVNAIPVSPPSNPTAAPAVAITAKQ